MERIDLALRRSGLDRDPGWVPWLQRVVRIEFVPDAADHGDHMREDGVAS
jgi:hypothetical protein